MAPAACKRGSAAEGVTVVRFQNPANGYIESCSVPWLWTLLVAPAYFAIKGAWGHVVGSIVFAAVSFGLSILVYPFFAESIVRSAYLRAGWREIVDDPSPPLMPEKWQHAAAQSVTASVTPIRRLIGRVWRWLDEPVGGSH
jgi:hypothetical protein